MQQTGRVASFVKVLAVEETALESAMPEERRRIQVSKRVCLMEHIILNESYDDKELTSDLEFWFFFGR